MNTTLLSLLKRLKHAESDASVWQRHQDIYLPLIRHWLSCLPGFHDEIEDLTQEILVVFFRELPVFERRRHGSFRAGLWQIAVNRMWAFCKSPHKQPLAGGGSEVEQLLAQLEDPSSELARQWDRDHDTRFALDGQSETRVAVELGVSERAVVQSKSRVLKRLRDKAGDLMD